jgi:hypothetical protein
VNNLKVDNNKNGWGRCRIIILNSKIMLLSKCKFNTQYLGPLDPSLNKLQVY